MFRSCPPLRNAGADFPRCRDRIKRSRIRDGVDELASHVPGLASRNGERRMNLRECLEAARINVLVRERVSSRADVEVVAIKEARLAVRRGRLQAGGKK